MRLYEADVRAANKLLKSKDKALHDLHKELRRTSRASSDGRGSTRPRSSSLVVKRESDPRDCISVDLLGLEDTGSSFEDVPVGGTTASVSSSGANCTSAQDQICTRVSAEADGHEPQADAFFPEAFTTPELCAKDSSASNRKTSPRHRPRFRVASGTPHSPESTKSPAGSSRERLLQQEPHRRARSLPTRNIRADSPVRQEAWWAPAVKVLSKAMYLWPRDDLVPSFCPRPTTGQRPCRESFPMELVDFEWNVEMDPSAGHEKMRLGLTLELPSAHRQDRQSLVIAEVAKGFALDKWNCSAFPVTVRIMPMGREAVARRVIVQAGDEIIQIDGSPAAGVGCDQQRKTIEHRLRTCTTLTLRRRVKSRSRVVPPAVQGGA